MLNKSLYDTLIAMFGRVQIKKAGMPMKYRISKDLNGHDTINHITDKEEGGEDYAVCCPVCSAAFGFSEGKLNHIKSPTSLAESPGASN